MPLKKRLNGARFFCGKFMCINFNICQNIEQAILFSNYWFQIWWSLWRKDDFILFIIFYDLFKVKMILFHLCAYNFFWTNQNLWVFFHNLDFTIIATLNTVLLVFKKKKRKQFCWKLTIICPLHIIKSHFNIVCRVKRHFYIVCCVHITISYYSFLLFWWYIMWFILMQITLFLMTLLPLHTIHMLYLKTQYQLINLLLDVKCKYNIIISN